MYKLILAIRYLFKRRISYFSVLAVALCVFVVFVVMTVLSGLTSEFKSYTHNSTGDCVVSTKSLVGFTYYEEFIEILESTDIIKAVSPVIKSYAVIDTSQGGVKFLHNKETIEIMGIKPTAHSLVAGFSQSLYHHKNNVADAFKPDYDPNLSGCVPGIAFLFPRDSEGNYLVTEEIPRGKIEISCVPLNAKGALAKAGLSEVSTKTFYFSDHAQSGHRADWTLIYLPFDDVQRLCGMATGDKRVSAIHIKFKPNVNLNKGCAQVQRLWDEFVATKSSSRHFNLLEKVKVQSWKTYSRIMMAAMESERTAMIFCFAMIGILTVFIVFVIFYMIVSHKGKDIGILKSVGVCSGNVMLVFLIFAFAVGIIGSSIGAIGGWYFLVHINKIEDWVFEKFGFQLWNRTMYAIGDIPNDINIQALSIIILSAIIACLIGAIIPSWQAARLKPVETLRVDQL